MDTLCSDLLVLVNNHLDFVQEILLDINNETTEDLNPLTNFKVWLHVFRKGYWFEAIKILFKNDDIRTLTFLSNTTNDIHDLPYIEDHITCIEIRQGTRSLKIDSSSINRLYIREIIKLACQSCDLDTIKQIHKYEYFQYTDLIFYIYKHSCKHKCVDIIEYVNSTQRSYKIFEAESIIQSGDTNFDPIERVFTSSIHTGWFIICYCIRYKRYDVINYLLRYMSGASLLDKYRGYLTLYHSELAIHSYSRMHGYVNRIIDDLIKSSYYDDIEFSSLLINFIHENWKVYSQYHDNILETAFYSGASDQIITKILQKWPNQAITLKISQTKTNIESYKRLLFTRESLINIKTRRGGFTNDDIVHLQEIFLIYARYDLIKSLSEI